MFSIFLAIFLIGFLVVIHELGHFLAARYFGVRVLKFSLGFGPRIFGKLYKGTDWQVSLFPLGGYVKLYGENEDEKDLEDDAFCKKSIPEKTGIVLAGPLANVLLALFLFSSVYMVGVHRIGTVVGEVEKKSPAFFAGIKKGDRIVSICGKKVRFFSDIFQIVKNSNGKELEMEVVRGKRHLTFRIYPKLSKQKNIFGEEVNIYRIGIVCDIRHRIFVRENPAKALFLGFLDCVRVSKLMALTIFKLIEGKLSFRTIGGPIRIVQIAEKQAKAGILSFLFFSGVLSINLGLINLFPIPVLDGGYIFFYVIEAIRREPLSPKNREIAQQIGMAILIILMILVIYNDLLSILEK